uniref:RAP domain-containing protein n=1 Tax=Aureoumbra lagunensis TaxID=44058 RepID=A0A7S3JV57_9STRA|mmetsp:Transcript_8448/g.12903  ORF Transcript_8448/g.12903 Transcript_8448/m.12903 type:complete len:1021 (+) Transcript_8448:35-3097(+)|eukprot:CAMPEP_0197317114 /NCGR_PEP_ID=MMETSP0891-20130614/45738_1 /TAXON_ID=44058 ORGANISM="Aureoumbra lagunensis, Strain CCMP1510" /NCGR_SAMPLE_ID=MMETSP0891 /ASSEMBLY_ACC=CAM_ASM_000534 /LENGTH=1020 /DNA_ID=CAMNT_0042806941 /DNA_START=24 /DNA_END=3086 /DNA_ORIENTATION=+
MSSRGRAAYNEHEWRQYRREPVEENAHYYPDHRGESLQHGVYSSYESYSQPPDESSFRREQNDNYDFQDGYRFERLEPWDQYNDHRTPHEAAPMQQHESRDYYRSSNRYHERYPSFRQDDHYHEADEYYHDPHSRDRANLISWRQNDTQRQRSRSRRRDDVPLSTPRGNVRDNESPRNQSSKRYRFENNDQQAPPRRRQSAVEVISRESTSRVSDINTSHPTNSTIDAHLLQQIHWNKAMISEKNATAESVLSLFAAEGDRFEARNLATAAHRAAKYARSERIRLEKDDRMLKLAEACQKQIHEFEPQGLANIAWAYAITNICVPDLYIAIAGVAQKKIHKFNPQEISTTAWAFVSAHVSAPDLLKLFTDQALFNLEAFTKNPQTVTNLLWAVSSAGIHAPNFFQQIARTILPKLEQYNIQQLAKCAWAFATVRIEDVDLYHKIADMALRIGLKSLNAENLANMAMAFASVGIHEPDLINSIAQIALTKLNDFTPNDFSNIAWAFASISMDNVDNNQMYACLEKMCSVCQNQLNQFSLEALENLIWAASNLRIQAPSFYSAFAATSMTKLIDFSSQALADTARAFAQADVDESTFFLAIIGIALTKMNDFTPRALADMAWAFSSVENDAILKAIQNTALAKLVKFSPQALADIAFAFANAGIEDTTFFLAISGIALTKLSEFTPDALANLAWSFARVNIRNIAFFKAIADEALPNFGEFCPQSLASIAWAFATLNIQAPWTFSFFCALAKAAVITFHDFMPQDFADVAWALACAGIYLPDFFKGIADATLNILDDFAPQALTNMIWAFAVVDMQIPTFFNSVSVIICSKLDSFSPNNVATIAWAFAVICYSNPKFFSDLLGGILSKEDQLNADDESQLYLVSLYFQNEFSDQQFPLAHLQERLESAYQPEDIHSDSHFDDVATTLNRIGWSHQPQFISPEGILLHLAQPEAKKAIQCDGVSNLCKCLDGFVQNGSTRFKSRLLRQCGWTLLHLPFNEWEQLTNTAAKDAYLQEKLRQLSF